MTTGAVALAMTATFGIAGTATSASAAPQTHRAAAAQPATTLLPVTGTLPDGTAFTGQLSNLTTSVVNGVLQLSGTVTGTGLPAGGTSFTAPIQDVTTNTACNVLNLDSVRSILTCWASWWTLLRCTSTSPRSRARASCSATCSALSPAC